MAVQAANVIDLQTYRQARANQNKPRGEEAKAVSFAMQPVMMWMPYWGFVPMMVMGRASHGA
ncbi:hypothetical protein [Pararhizobium sp. LjRoot238]|uniref:hypothetical protein n=1 Tax=Pararhizobium sp. LjRoot238 TaxID=3342293 RepID=UPI003ECDFD54